MTNLEKLIETLQNAPIEKTACFIFRNAERPCSFCIYDNTTCEMVDDYIADCKGGIKQWLESEADKC